MGQKKTPPSTSDVATPASSNQVLLASLDSQISDAKKYLKEQQALIDQTINDWNAQLKEFRDEGNAVAEQKEQLARDVLQYEEDKRAIDKSAKESQQKAEALDEVYQTKVTAYRDELLQLEREIQGLLERKRIIEQENIARIDAVNERETALKAKEQDYMEKSLALDEREKQIDLNTKLNNSGILST